MISDEARENYGRMNTGWRADEGAGRGEDGGVEDDALYESR